MKEKIQLITYPPILVHNFSNITLSRFNEFYSLDTYEYTIIRLNIPEILHYDDSTETFTKNDDFESLKINLNDSRKSKIIVLLPQNITVYKYGEIKNNLNILYEYMNKYYSLNHFELHFGKNKTEVNEKYLSADFYFSNALLNNYHIITKNTNGHVTTIEHEDIIYTTLDFKSDGDIFQFISHLEQNDDNILIEKSQEDILESKESEIIKISNDSIKIFQFNFDDFVKTTMSTLQSIINSLDINLILYNKQRYIPSLINQFKVDRIEVKFDEMTYSKKTIPVKDDEGNPEKWNMYTFNVPFEGDKTLLNYFSNNGRGTVSPYYIENDIIIFESPNNDLKNNPLNINNRIEILKDMVNNLNKEYEHFNETLKENIEYYIEYRDQNLIKFEEFCSKYKLSEEEIKKMKFKLSALETLSQIIGENYNGSEITSLFKKAGYPEIIHDGSTKWKFVCETFENMQEESIEGVYKILKVLEVVCDPQEYILKPKVHKEVLEKVNMTLSFYGLKFSEDGELNQLNSVNTKLKPKTENPIQNEEKYDVFISHSSSDKDWVDELYECLSKTDLKIWYDIGIIRIGDNIREKINDGLVNSDYGIVVLSEEFIKRPWPKMEFDGLISLMDEGKLLPIIHGLDKEKLEQFFKPLSTIHYLSTEKYTTKQICLEIYSKIKEI